MQYKKNQKKIFKFLLIIFLFIASIVAMVFGSINIGKNNTQKGLFGEQYFMSYALDLSNAGSTQLDKEKTLKSTADAFSAWLISKNINATNIEYSIDKDNNNVGYLYTERLNVSKIEYEGQKNVNQNPYFIALDTISTSRIEIQQYNPGAKGKNELPSKIENNYTNEQNWYSQVATPSDLNMSSARKDYRDKLVTNDKTKNYGVQVDIANSKQLDIGAFDKDKTNSAEKKVEWIIFQDLDVLLAKLNYAKDLAARFSKNILNNDERRYYNTLPSNFKEWASAAIKSTSGAQNTTPINRSNILYFYKNVPESSGDSSTPSTIADSTDPNANASLKSIVDQYVIGTIDYNNYNDWFPGTKVIGNSNSGDSNSGNNSGNSGNNGGNNSGGNNGGSTRELYAQTKDTHLITSLSFQTTKSEQARSEFINRVKKMTFSVPLKEYSSGSINDYVSVRNSLFKAWINQSYIYDSLTGMKAYESSMLALGVVVLLIAIIVSILYRIPGLFAGFAIICASVFSASLLVVLKVNFSISTIVGLFVAIICALCSVVLFMERFRKSIKDNSSVFDSNINTIKKSLFSILDVNMIMLFFGLGSIFVGKGEIVDFGLVLVLSSLITLASIFLYFVLPVFLCVDFYVLWNPKFHIFYNKNKIKEISPNSIFSFGEKYVKFIAPILIGISILVFIIGLIMVFSLGVKNSTYYSNGTVVYLDYSSNASTNGSPNVADVLKWLPTNSWTFLWNNTDAKVMAFSSKNVFTLSQIMNNNFPSTYKISVAMSSSTYAIDVSKSIIYAILIAYGFVAIYGIFRLNFFSIIPVFISSCLGSLVPIALCYMLWLPIDSLFIYASLFISIITTIVSFLYVSITKTRFNKRKISKFNELLSFVIINILNTKNIMIILLSIILLSSVLFILLGSLTMIMLFIYIIVGTILGMLISYLLIPFLYFVSLYIRQKYVKNILSNVESKLSRNVVNEVDEELIEGINKFN